MFISLIDTRYLGTYWVVLPLLFNNTPSRPCQVGKAVKSGTGKGAHALVTIAEKAIKTISALHTSMTATVANPIKAFKKAIANMLAKHELEVFLICESCFAPQVRHGKCGKEFAAAYK